MKKLGLIFDKQTRFVFLLPEDIKKIVSNNVQVFVSSGYGSTNNISDSEYVNAGATVTADVINNADIIIKSNAFTKNELNAMSNKIAITLANFASNVDMLYLLLKNNIKSYEWVSLVVNDQYAFFNQIEEIKGQYAVQKVQDIFPKLTNEFNSDPKIEKIKAKIVKKNKTLNVLNDNKVRALILNAGFASNEIISRGLELGWQITLLDYDLDYCKKLSKSFGGKLAYASAEFNTLEKTIKDNNVFINAVSQPFERTSLRITSEMVETMPCPCLLLDLSCENGYNFMFQKKLIKEPEELVYFDKPAKKAYLCPKNIAEIYPNEASTIYSHNSVDSLVKLANEQEDDFYNILITDNGECKNKYLKDLLNI